MEEVEVEQLNSVLEVESVLAEHKDTICRKSKLRAQVAGDKKLAMGGFNDQLKALDAEIEEELEILDVLNARRLELEALGK